MYPHQTWEHSVDGTCVDGAGSLEVLCPVSHVPCATSCTPCPVSHVLYPVYCVLCPTSCVSCPLSCVLCPVSHIPCPIFHVPSQVPGAEPFQGHSSVQEAVPLHSVTRLSLNATPSWYLNHIKAFSYYISPCDFAWLHSNYQPCCSTRGLHCLLLLPFYGKWLILHNPNQSTAVR